MNLLKKFNIDFNKSLVLAFIALGIIAVLLQFCSRENSSEHAENSGANDNFEVDTMIPAGHLLIPIQLSNAESLASLAGPYAVVDLYALGEKGRKGFKIASSLKLLRAPLNPDQFAVLVREEDSSQIVTREGPFFAALKSRSEANQRAKEKVRKTPLIIHYGE